MADMGRFRGWLVALVALTLLAGLVLVSVPSAGTSTPGPGDTALTSGRPAPWEALGGASHAPSIGRDERADAVRELLERRSSAVLRRDEAAFLNTVDPVGEAGFRAAQRAMFDNLGDLVFGEWRYTLDAGQSLPPPALPAGVPAADELWAPKVELRYAFEGVDTTPTTRSLGYLFARRGSDWFLVSDTALEPQGRRTWRGPWDFGPCRWLRTRHGLVVGHPGNEALAAAVGRELDGAVAAVSEVWGAAWPEQVVVLLPESPAELQAMVGPDFSLDGIAAVAVADRVDTRAGTVEGARVVINPRTAARLSPTPLRVVLRHEITHVAARGVTVDGAPMWLTEGFADYVGYRDSGLSPAQAAPALARGVRAGALPDDLPANRDFQAGGDQLDLAYQRAWSFAVHLTTRFGEQQLVRLYRRIAAAGPTGTSTMDSILTEELGVRRADLLDSWRRHLVAAFR
ncbi:hypothetical protein [Streptoalloteichus hindustanus]|uniref:Peptidase MA superfamily protein n=1 Tax=Streptoalloteichus hindustanus TaxID=2017 RepID=A0A1M5BRG2_STRHI|nr:hypothetical protein [Streptoalloteichus hindustanus]SHF44990.1 hypothetical protein SAMN05444320_103694 [Streptoalloteichus hindustanus]